MDLIEELLQEAEEDERKLHLAHIDLMLSEMRKLEIAIADNFSQSEEEKKIIDEWAITKNVKLQEKADRIANLLKLFMESQEAEVKTIDLPNGKLTRRKGQDKIVIVDMEAFLQNANKSMFTLQPEMVKPNLTKIKAFYKMTLKVPLGTKLIEGEEKFNIKLNGASSKEATPHKKEIEENGTKETRVGVEQTDEYRDAV